MLKKPIGGYRIVYEYANRLADRGYDVSIVFLNDNALNRFHLPPFMKKSVVELFTKIEPRWFKFHKNVKKVSSTSAELESVISKCEIAIGTGANTIYPTIELFYNSKIVYFVQGYESWIYSEEELRKTYGLDLEIIVIAEWMKQIIDEYAIRPSVLIKNPIDTGLYTVSNRKREKFSIGLLYHTDPNKGFKYSYEAICELKKMYPELNVKMFGTFKPDFVLPDWIEFTYNASFEDTVTIYNSISVFISSPVIDGFGLTGLEAMACGAVLVCSEYKGAKEYAIDNYNALISPIGDIEKLISNVKKVFDDDGLRNRLMENGVNTAKKFSWQNAVDLFDNTLKSYNENK